MTVWRALGKEHRMIALACRRCGSVNLRKHGCTATGQQSIFQARHLYVHQGQEVGDEAIPYRAVMLALSCLLLYAKSVVTFSDKPDFIRYLDFVYKAEQLSSVWNERQRKNFSRLLKHDRASVQLPFGLFP